RRPLQRQWLICDVADGEPAELLPRQGVDKGRNEGRVETPPLGQRRSQASASGCGNGCEADECEAEEDNSTFQINRRSGGSEQNRDRGGNERDAAEQH